MLKMVRQWIEDIRTKTKDMDREHAAEYVLNYYWYHILLGAIALGLLILLIYHVFWGRNQKPEFTCVIVNQEVNFSRDARMAEQFSAFSGIREKKCSIDSDYLISYDEVELPEANESSYEKFFFNWSSGVIDAVVMPESFYKYCLELGGAFCNLREMSPNREAGMPENQINGGADAPENRINEGADAPENRINEGADALQNQIYEGAGDEASAMYVKGTALEKWLADEEEDPLLLVFPVESKHKENGGKFLEYALEAAEK